VELRFLGRDGKRQRVVRAGEGVHQAEEVTKRRDHTRRLLVVPIHLENDLPVIVRVNDFPTDAQGIMDLKHGHPDDVRVDLAGPWLDPA